MHCVKKITCFWHSSQFSPRYELKCGKMPYLAMLVETVLDQDSEADDLQNLTSSTMSKDTSLVKFSRRSDH